MKQQFIWGLLLAFLFVTPLKAQEQTTTLSFNSVLDLKSKDRKSSLTYNEYLNVGYYYLRTNKSDQAERYFKLAKKKRMSYFKNYRSYRRTSFTKRIEAIQKEADSLANLSYITNVNSKIQKEIDLYKSVTKKSFGKLITLKEEAQQKNKTLNLYLGRWKKKSGILKTFISENRDLMKPKSEFETKEQYQARKDKYKNLEKEAAKEINLKLEKLDTPFNEALKACSLQKSKIDKRAKTNEFIKKYPPVLKKYADSRIKKLTYNAEKQEFTLSIEFKKENDLYRYKTKNYTISVPQSEAQQFKESQLNNQYFFFLQDLRAVISNGKTYTINPINRWYMRLNCDKEIEEAVLLVNNTPDTRDIKTYLEKIIISKPPFLKEAKRLQQSYLDDYTKGVRAEISIIFDEKGSYKHTVVEYKRGNRLVTENLNRDGSDKQGGAKRSLFSSVNEIMRKQNIKIQPPTKQCEPQSSVFTFDYILSKSLN
ncbi:conserved exported protein of unknown function [Tenacibaculum sp. 190524A02b]|uniref:hypothetical protein n=1 Tax=Tenacibaculum vairaonense TaxID=3137860 RepID=UPI0032B25FDB